MERPLRATPRRSQADEWALVLEAAGVPHRVVCEGDRWWLVVPDDEVQRAVAALQAYEEETRPEPSAPSAEDLAQPLPWTTGLVAALALLAFFAVTGPPAAGARWFERGAASAGKIRDGEPWRAVTALTLHLDAVHVSGNAVATAVLLPAAAQRFGVGLGLLLTLLAGIGGNLLGALAHAPDHLAVGASTATFGTIGILAGARLVSTPGPLRTRRRTWMVVAATVVLLAMLGSSQGSDVLAHALGVVSGVALGLIASMVFPRPPGVLSQTLLVVAVLLLVAAAWFMALAELSPRTR